MRNKGKKDRGRLKNWLIWIDDTPNACGTNLSANSFSKINGVFEPLLAPRGWRVHRIGAQVGINRCWRASGWSLAWPDGLRTLLLGDGVLKHTLINWEWETEEEREGEHTARFWLGWKYVAKLQIHQAFMGRSLWQLDVQTHLWEETERNTPPKKESSFYFYQLGSERSCCISTQTTVCREISFWPSIFSFLFQFKWVLDSQRVEFWCSIPLTCHGNVFATKTTQNKNSTKQNSKVYNEDAHTILRSDDSAAMLCVLIIKKYGNTCT